MRWAHVALAVIAVLALLWLAGEKHRENCIKDGRTDCSILPWEEGTDPTPYDEYFGTEKEEQEPGGAYEEVFGP